MVIKDTIKQLRDLLSNITIDLGKAEGGNKAASQRVRTGTVKLEKIAKLYRKESIKTEKQTKDQKKPAKKVATKPKAAKNPPQNPIKAKASPKKATSKATVKVKAKPKIQKQTTRPRALSFKRPTAKLPTKTVTR